MSPKIISDQHNKSPIGYKELQEYYFDSLIEQIEITDFSPDNLMVRFSMLENDNDGTGTVTIEIIENNQAIEVIGNINFSKLDKQGTCLENGVQISSAYFNSDYRGQGLGSQAYEIIAKQYLLISDCTQTHEGSAFWKYKIGDNNNLEVYLVITPTGDKPYKMVDEKGEPIIYHYSKENLDPMIWGLEFPNQGKHSDINASTTNLREDVVLIARYKKND